MAIMLCPYCDKDRASNEAIGLLHKECSKRFPHLEYESIIQKLGMALEGAGLCGCLYLHNQPDRVHGGNLSGITRYPSLDYYDHKWYGWNSIAKRRKPE